MNKKQKIITISLLFFSNLLFSCSKKIESKIGMTEEAVKEVSIIENTNKIPFVPEKSYNMDLTEYKVYGHLKPAYEFGYDDNYHAYLTDLRTNRQVVFLCSSYDPSYMKEEFFDIYKDAFDEDRDVGNGLAYRIEWCKEIAVKKESFFDEHFGCVIERYYVKYTDAYRFFHV